MPTGSLFAFPPPPQCWLLPRVLWTRRAGCWSGRNVRRGCPRCLCRYLQLLRLESGKRRGGKRKREWDQEKLSRPAKLSFIPYNICIYPQRVHQMLNFSMFKGGFAGHQCKYVVLKTINVHLTATQRFNPAGQGIYTAISTVCVQFYPFNIDSFEKYKTVMSVRKCHQGLQQHSGE